MAYCYFKGEIIDESKAGLSINTIGLLRGFGVFDIFRSRNEKPAFMEDHLTRFDQSQKILNLSNTISPTEIRQAVHDLQQKNKFKESIFRLMLLGDGDENEEFLNPLFYITNINITGIKQPSTANLITYEYKREFPKIKSINYLTSTILHQKKKDADAIDVLYHSNGIVTEASRSNIFMIKNGILMTPSKNILEGITRKKILMFASEILPLEIKDITLEEIMDADEVFLTSSLKEVMAITSIDTKKIGNGQAGAFTLKIKQAFLELVN